MRGRAPFDLEVVDISADPELRERYGERIPVVLVDGEPAFEYIVDEGSARAAPVHGRSPELSAESGMASLHDEVIGADGASTRSRSATGCRSGVAARLSRYLQVLTQARKMGKDTISSQELSDYTHINSTQIRRDLSGFGKFGKRGVGYNVDSLVSQIRKILRTSGQHNIALFGAGNLGQAIASSDIFADHGFRVVAIFDVEPKRIGKKVGALDVRPYESMREVVDEEDIVVGVLAAAGRRRAARRRRPRRGGREDHLQLLRRAAPGPAGRDGPHIEPGRGPAVRALLLSDLVRAVRLGFVASS